MLLLPVFSSPYVPTHPIRGLVSHIAIHIVGGVGAVRGVCAAIWHCLLPPPPHTHTRAAHTRCAAFMRQTELLRHFWNVHPPQNKEMLAKQTDLVEKLDTVKEAVAAWKSSLSDTDRKEFSPFLLQLDTPLDHALIAYDQWEEDRQRRKSERDKARNGSSGGVGSEGGGVSGVGGVKRSRESVPVPSPHVASPHVAAAAPPVQSSGPVSRVAA